MLGAALWRTTSPDTRTRVTSSRPPTLCSYSSRWVPSTATLNVSSSTRIFSCRGGEQHYAHVNMQSSGIKKAPKRSDFSFSNVNICIFSMTHSRIKDHGIFTIPERQFVVQQQQQEKKQKPQIYEALKRPTAAFCVC